MPQCKFCGDYPYVTYCKGFQLHVMACQALFEKEKEIFRLKNELKSFKIQTVNNYTQNNYIQNNYTQNNFQFYLDYPKNNTTETIMKRIENIDITTIKDKEDVNKIISYAENFNNQELALALESKNPLAQSQANSFLANLVRIIRNKMERDTPEQVDLIKRAKEFESECFEDKKTALSKIH